MEKEVVAEDREKSAAAGQKKRKGRADRSRRAGGDDDDGGDGGGPGRGDVGAGGFGEEREEDAHQADQGQVPTCMQASKQATDA